MDQFECDSSDSKMFSSGTVDKFGVKNHKPNRKPKSLRKERWAEKRALIRSVAAERPAISCEGPSNRGDSIMPKEKSVKRVRFLLPTESFPVENLSGSIRTPSSEASKVLPLGIGKSIPKLLRTDVSIFGTDALQRKDHLFLLQSGFEFLTRVIFISVPLLTLLTYLALFLLIHTLQ